MRHIPAHCPEFLMNVRPGQTLAATDWKELVFVGSNEFTIYQHVAAGCAWSIVRKHGFDQARDFYNTLPYPVA